MKLVVFDVDGTLVDSGAEIARRVNLAFADLGLPPPTLETIRASVGLSLPIYMAAVAGTDDPELVDRLVAAYRATASVTPPGRMPLFAGAREALERLHARREVLLGIATGKGRVGLESTLSQNGIGSFFVTLQTPDTNPSKPHPSMLLSAMAETGATAQETVMVGDAVFDIEMAQAAGVKSIAVSWGLQPVAKLRAAGAAAVIGDFEALDAAIDRLLETVHA